MSTYRNPSNLPLLTEPLGIDVQIQNLQQELAEQLTWLEYSFGRAFIGEDEQFKGKDYTYPMVYKGSGNYQDASPNDNLISQSFFVVSGDYQYQDYQINQPNKFTVPVALIVWGNLKRISSTDEHFGQVLLQDVLKVIRNNEEFKVTSINDNESEVYKEFSISKEPTSLFYYPYFCYRINMNLASSEECFEEIDTAKAIYNLL